MQLKAGRSPLVGGWLAFAVDGTKFEVPWTKDNENHLGETPGKAKSKGKSKTKSKTKAKAKSHGKGRHQGPPCVDG